MKIKLYSPYNHFPSYIPEEGEKYIPCYNDAFVMQEDKEPRAIALLIEPRPLQPKVYDYIEKCYGKFMYVFTHDSALLKKIPNAKLIIWGGVWSWADEEKDFNHPVSMVASWKGETPVRIQRRELAKELKGEVDTYGTFDGGQFASTHDIYAKYPFSIVIENHIDDYWITEKICNCFANKTIPIYWGARKIYEFFNPQGIITAEGIDDIKTILEQLNPEVDYYSRFDAVQDNYKRVRAYQKFETWFMKEYGELLEEL